MKLINSLLDYEKAYSLTDVLCFTANNVISYGKLVMGGGNALACKKAFPTVDKAFAIKLENYHNTNYLTSMISINGTKIMAIQTKEHYAKPSPLSLVKASINNLEQIARYYPDMVFHLPMPAVGLGGLTLNEVMPIVECLPNNVWVYYVSSKK